MVSAPGKDHRPLEYEAEPATHLWTAACLALGGAAAAAGLTLALGAWLAALQAPALEAIFLAQP